MKPRLTVGRYEVYDSIARGGMGAVHLGRLLGAVGFGRIVAIKRMHPQLAGEPEVARMFLDEARLAARVQHPNVVSVLDVVEAGEELLLVMEYVRGESLSLLLKAALRGGRPAPVGVAASIVAQALHGLHAAHEARGEDGAPLDLVHRDVSPQNVFVGVDGLARVLDFGVAKSSQRLTSTREGEIKGKPAYMAPEQLRGQATRRTDVYAAGVVLWEALAGRRLFAGETEVETMALVIAGAIEDPSAHRPEVPAALAAIARRALAADPAARFATAREMALAIEQAGELASVAEVGAWVDAVGGEAIAKRDALAARIEQMARPQILPAEGTPLPAATAPSGEPTRGEPITLTEAVRTRHDGPRPSARRTRALAALSTAALIAGGAIGAFVFRLSGQAPAPVASASGSMSLAHSSVPLPPPPPPTSKTAPVPAPAPAPVPAPAASAATSAAPLRPAPSASSAAPAPVRALPRKRPKNPDFI